MDHSFIKPNTSLLQGVAVINSLNSECFSTLLKHIFNGESIEKISNTLSEINEQNRKLLLQCIFHIYKQSMKIIIKPTVLQEQLVEVLKFDAYKAEEFVTFWTQETKKNFDVENLKKLEDIMWTLNLETSSNFCSVENHLNARLQFNVGDVNTQNRENISLEMNENELKQLYATLENIQSKLDSY